MPDLLARSDYPLPAVDPLLALALGFLVAAAVLAVVAWLLGAFDGTRQGRHAADVLPMSPWINERYEDAKAWIARYAQAQRELADARRGGEER